MPLAYTHSVPLDVRGPDVGSLTDARRFSKLGKTNLPFSNVEHISQFGKILIDADSLMASSISSQPFIQGHCITLRVLPFGYTWRDLPGLLFFYSHLESRRVHYRDRRGWWSLGNFLTDPESWRLHRVYLPFYDPNNPLFSS